MIEYTTVTQDAELAEILALQRLNLPTNLSEEEAKAQGFVTVVHDIDLLRKLNTPCPHIIAKDTETNKVVGYALVMLKELGDSIPVLVPMFELLGKMSYKGQAMSELSYFTMGQVCIAKDYRGQGLFAGLYAKMKTEMRDKYDLIITEISVNNKRSQRAHAKVGFKEISAYTDENDLSWKVVVLDLC